MKLNYTRIFVNDQDKALRFYTETLGFAKKGDVSNGGYRWLTVVPSDDQNGVELVLELNSNPPAKAYQEAVFEQNAPALNIDVTDVQAEYDRLEKLGVQFTMEPTQVMEGVTIAIFNDTCGNLIQLQKTPGK